LGNSLSCVIKNRENWVQRKEVWSERLGGHETGGAGRGCRNGWGGGFGRGIWALSRSSATTTSKKEREGESWKEGILRGV